MAAIKLKDTASFMRLVYEGGKRSHPNSLRKEVGDDQTEDLVNLMQEILNENKHPVEKQFVKLILEALDVDEQQMLLYKYRKHEIVLARQLHMYIRKFYFNMSYPVAASIYEKDHATAMHAAKTILNIMDTDKQFRIDTNKVWLLWKSSGIAFPEEFKIKWLDI